MSIKCKIISYKKEKFVWYAYEIIIQLLKKLSTWGQL